MRGLSLAVAIATAGPAAGAPEEPAARWALVQQEELPAFDARVQAAGVRTEARLAFFGGEAELGEAFPRVDAGSLGSPAVLAGRLGLLDEAAVERARERAAPVPELGPDAREALYRARRAEALDAEEQADGLERRLLVGVLALLRDHPELTESGLAPLRQPWQEVISAAEALGDEVDAEARAAAQHAAARADEELRWLGELVRDLRLAGVRDGRLPDPAADLARLADPERDEGAAQRLDLLRPWLSGEAADRVREALATWWRSRPLEEANEALEGVRSAASSELQALPPEALSSRREEVAAEEAELRAELEQLDGEGPLVDARREVLSRRLEAATLRLVALDEALQRKERQGVDASAELREAKTQAQLAQEQAQAARAQAADARDRRRADALADHAAAQARSAALWERAQAADERVEKVRSTWLDRVARLQRQVEQVRELSALHTDRPDPDAVYREVRALLSELRGVDAARGSGVIAAERLAADAHAAVERDRERLAQARELLSLIEDPVAGEELRAATLRWEKVLEDEERAAEELVTHARDERDALLRALHDARIARRQLEPEISRQQFAQDRRFFLEDMGQELALLGPSLLMMLRDRFHGLLDLPSTLLDFNVLRGLLVGSFWTIVLLLGWLWAHERSDDWAVRIADRVRRWRPELRRSDLFQLRDPTTRFVRSLVDLALGRLLMWSLGDTLPEIAFVLLVYLQVALYRALLAFFDLAVIPNSEVRPALVVLRKERYARARQTVQLFLGFFIARSFVDYLLWEVLGLDTLSRAAGSLFQVAFWGLVGWTLYVWEPALRERVARRNQESRVVRWLARESELDLLRIPRAIGILVFFAVALVVDLFYALARDGTSLAWLFNVLNRARLKEEGAEKVRPLPEPLVRRIVELPVDEDLRIERPELLPVVAQTLAEWERTHRRGLVAVVGDRGTGKKVASDQLVSLLTDARLPVVRKRVSERLHDDRATVRWLAELAELPGELETVDDLVEALQAAEPRAFLLEGLHRTFTRKVGGFEALTTLLFVFNATSDRHFWVVTVHGPAWDWLASVGSLVDCGVFRTVVRLQPLTSTQLRELTVRRTEAAGLAIDFGRLSRPNALGSDPAVELERGIGVFYRLLQEASDGNPTTALYLWARCLELVEGTEDQVRVRMSAALSTTVLTDLTDDALFSLVALRIQDVLDERELAEVTNLPSGTLRNTLRDLLARGLLVRTGSRLAVPDEHLSVVSRTLRRRHFLHLGAT